MSWNFFKISFRASSLGRSVGRSPVGALAVVLRRGENHTGGRRPRLQPLRRRVVLIAHFKVGCGGERVSHASARTRTGCTTSLLPHSLPLLRSAWTERESERAGQARVGRTILRSAEFFFLHSLPSSLARSVFSLASDHERHLRMRCRPRRRRSAFTPLFLSLPLSVSVSTLQCSLLLPRISPVTSLPFFPFLRCSSLHSLAQSMTKSAAHEISPTHLRMPLSLLSVP